jgi:hypothetical protein
MVKDKFDQNEDINYDLTHGRTCRPAMEDAKLEKLIRLIGKFMGKEVHQQLLNESG